MKGLICNLYQSATIGNCSAGGLSSRVQSVTLIGPGVAGPFEPTPECPAVRLIRRDNVHGCGECYAPYIHAEPDLTHPSNAQEVARLGGRTEAWFMAGGTLLHTSDSRFFDALGHHYPISFHDRCEL